MRVITGTAKGRPLATLAGDDVRPTVERVKEGLFSAIQFEIEGRRVLDLFAGSGQLGIEALSRGAAAAVFCDTSREAIAVVKGNLEKTGLAPLATVNLCDSLQYLRSHPGRFDIAFLDPPYATGLLQKALPLVAGLINEGGAILCESPDGEAIPQTVGTMGIFRTYRYGRTRITLYRHGAGEEASL